MHPKEPVVKLRAPRRTSDNATKLAFLDAVKARKDVLFAKFSNVIDNNRKKVAWEEVTEIAKSLNVVAAHRDSLFVRDSVFGLWKSRTLKKVDNAGRTGTGGGRSAILTELDHAILDIVGRDSPVIQGLPVGEVGGNVADVPFIETEAEEDELLDIPSPSFGEQPSTSRNCPSAPPTVNMEESSANKNNPKRKAMPNDSTFPFKTRRFDTSEKENILLEKWRAQSELMRQQAYNVKLQNWKLERELNVVASPLTEGVQQKNVEVIEVLYD